MRSKKAITIKDNYKNIVVLDGELYGISFPTEKIMDKFQQIMIVEHPELVIRSFVTDENDESWEPRSSGSSYISNIKRTDAGFSFTIQNDPAYMDRDIYQGNDKIKTIAEVSDSTTCNYYSRKRKRLEDDIWWRPVLIPLTKNKQRDFIGVEPNGTLTKGLTMYYRAMDKQAVPIKPYELYYQDVERGAIWVGDTHQSEDYQMLWVWVDGVLVSVYCQSQDSILEHSKWGTLFSEFLLDK